MQNTMGQALVDSGVTNHLTEVSRELSETGRAWLIVMKDDQGRQCTVSRLRSHREGNGF